MDVQILQEDLIKVLNNSIRFINNKGTLPILSNFLLKASKTKLQIESTNLEMSISNTIGAKIEETGEVTVPAKTFLEIIANLGIGQIRLSTDKESLKIESQGVEVKLATIPPNDFPQIPESINKEKSFKLPVKNLKSNLDKVLFATSLDEARPVLCGVLFIFENSPEGTNSLTLVASDGFRLSKKSIPMDHNLAGKSIIIPRNSLLELIKLASGSDDLELELRESENQLVAKVGDVIFATRLIDGNFPDFEKIIPKATSTNLSLNKDDLGRGVKLASVFARVEGNVVKLKIKEGSVEITSENAKFGKQKNIIEANAKGGELEISYNYKFLEDFVNVCESPDIEIQLVDSVSPSIFVDPKDKDFLHIIMPVRVQG